MYYIRINNCNKYVQKSMLGNCNKFLFYVNVAKLNLNSFIGILDVTFIMFLRKGTKLTIPFETVGKRNTI